MRDSGQTSERSLRDMPDVCIVGAGLAGGLLAYELGRKGVRVVVLEAGPRHDLQQRFAYMERSLRGGKAWAARPERDGYTNAGSYLYDLNEMRTKGVGGSTLHWNALATRLHATDFAMRQHFGVADDWPITYEELEPYYSRAEAELGVAGTADNPFASPRSAPYPLPPFPLSYSDGILRRASADLGITFHGAPYARNSIPHRGRPACMAFGTCGPYRVCPIGAQYSAETHVDLAVASGNVELFTEAAVVRLNAEGHEVRSATWIGADRREHEQRARVFVLAAHAVESARLLLLSTSGSFRQGLANGSGLVGRNLMEHPALYGSGTLKQPLFPHRVGFHTVESHQFCNPPDRDRAAAFKLEGTNDAGPKPAALAVQSGLWGEALAEEIRQTFGRQMTMVAMLEQLPEAQNSVSLDPLVKDSFGDPVPRITLGFGEYEENRRAGATATMTAILERLGATKIISSLAGEFGVCAHQMGTCRMGDDPATSVVDRNLRCHEVENLFVAGSSVFVTGGSVNPSLTIAALGLRLADFLRRPDA